MSAEILLIAAATHCAQSLWLRVVHRVALPGFLSGCHLNDMRRHARSISAVSAFSGTPNVVYAVVSSQQGTCSFAVSNIGPDFGAGDADGMEPNGFLVLDGGAGLGFGAADLGEKNWLLLVVVFPGLVALLGRGFVVLGAAGS